MSNILTQIESKSVNYEFLYMDIDFPTVEISKGPMTRNPESDINTKVVTFKKGGLLTERDSDFNEDTYIGKYLSENLKPADIAHPRHSNRSLFSFTISDYTTEQKEIGDIERKFISKIMSTFYYIATEGRIGMPDTIVLNKDMHEKWFLNEYVNLNERMSGIKFVINEEINDNEICIIKNTDQYSPGYKYIKHVDQDNKLYSNIIPTGMYPEKQAVKFKIYH